MGSRIQKFLIIHTHSNSNMNIKACYHYYVAPVPSGIFKLYREHAQNQGCGELKIVIIQKNKGWSGIINSWGFSLPSPLYLDHSISLILPLNSWTTKMRQLQTHPSSKTLS